MKKLLLCLTVLALPMAANAVPLTPGVFSTALPGTTAAAEPGLAGTVVKDDLVPFTLVPNANSHGAPVGHGQVQVRVVKDKAGALTFYWRIINASDSKPITRFLVRGDPYKTFPEHAYDVNWRVDGLGAAAPDHVTAPSTSAAGSSYEFEFKQQPVAPGTSSRFFYIKTTATNFGKARVAAISDLGSAATFASSVEFEAVGPLF